MEGLEDLAGGVVKGIGAQGRAGAVTVELLPHRRPVSFAAAATAMGAAGAAVTTEQGLATALAAARRPGPTVIDAGP